MTNEPRLIDVNAVIDRLAAAKRVLVTTHVRADGDAIGSALGLARILRGTGREARAMLHEHVPSRYAFLPDTSTARVWNGAAAASDIAWADLLVIVDTCSAGQLGDVAGAISTAPRRLAIDHHATREPIVPEAWSNTAVASCTMMIHQLACAGGWNIDGEAATLLFTGLATDTGWFRHSNTDMRALASASELAKLGASPPDVYEALYLREPEAKLRLIGAVLGSFELHGGGRLAVIRVTREMLQRCGATDAMTEEIINEPLRVSGVRGCVLLVEPERGQPVRVSFRGRHGLDVAAVARQFGGGGHTAAAGAKVTGEFNAVCERVIASMLGASES